MVAQPKGRLVHRFPVHVDGLCLPVDVHGLALGGDDPLDDRLFQDVGDHHHVPLLNAEGRPRHQDPVPVVVVGLHRGAVHGDDPAHEGEHQRDDHHGEDQLLRPVEQILPSAVCLL